MFDNAPGDESGGVALDEIELVALDVEAGDPRDLDAVDVADWDLRERAPAQCQGGDAPVLCGVRAQRCDLVIVEQKARCLVRLL